MGKLVKIYGLTGKLAYYGPSQEKEGQWCGIILGVPKVNSGLDPVRGRMHSAFVWCAVGSYRGDTSPRAMQGWIQLPLTAIFPPGEPEAEHAGWPNGAVFSHAALLFFLILARATWMER